MLTLPSFQTDRIVLNPIFDSDIQHIFKGLSDLEVTKYYGIHCRTLEETYSQMRWYRQLLHDETGGWWGIRVLPSGEFVGAIGFNYWKKNKSSADIGCWLLPKFQRKGLMKEIAPIIISYLQDTLNIHKLIAEIESENVASIEFFSHLGFHLESTKKDAEIKNGTLISLHFYVKMKEQK